VQIEFSLRSAPDRMRIELVVPTGTSARLVAPPPKDGKWRQLRFNNAVVADMDAPLHLTAGRSVIDITSNLPCGGAGCGEFAGPTGL